MEEWNNNDQSSKTMLMHFHFVILKLTPRAARLYSESFCVLWHLLPRGKLGRKNPGCFSIKGQ